MATIESTDLKQSAVLYLYAMKSDIIADPPYQRQSDVWPRSKKQLLIDSILNDFDIPKFYLHRLDPTDEKQQTHAIIDGKQRLEAIWDFVDGAFPLADEIDYLRDPSVKLQGLTYAELGRQFPRIKQKFDSTSLSVVQISTTDIELIEEMFTRLNEAATLSAAEKRNALGGPVPPIIRSLASHKFFNKRLPFTNTRYRHFDLACKFLLLAQADKIGDTKKMHLDEYVRRYKRRADSPSETQAAIVELTSVETKVLGVLDQLYDNFTEADPILSSVGLVVVYFCLFDREPEIGDHLTRSSIAAFERIRKENRTLAQEELIDRPPSYQLLEFDRLMQAPNDASSIRYKMDVLKTYMQAGAPNSLEEAIAALPED